ncbi:MAG: hypothetical protein GY790_11050 [Bacteroidetes bacterium]|nr:hypothetical protein [Bacteroidota bacterium]
MCKNRTFLVIGQVTLVLGVMGEVINFNYLNNNPIVAFLSGLFFGLSVVMNMTFLVRIRRVPAH